jgi:hypothetical protein
MSVDSVQVGYLSHIFHNRLKITVARNGITFVRDIREKRQWMRAMLEHGETAVFEELDPDYDLMYKYMCDCGWSTGDMRMQFKALTGVSLDDC